VKWIVLTLTRRVGPQVIDHFLESHWVIFPYSCSQSKKANYRLDFD